MARKQKEEPISYDPIAVQQRIQEREDFHRNLFLPMMVDIRHDLQWLVEGMIPRDYLVLLASPPKAGKSCLATAMALAVATGTPFAGRKTEQGAVLWISGEENPTERQIIYDQSSLADPATPIFTCYQRLNIDDEDALMALGRWVNETQAKLIVVDSLLACSSGRTLQDSWNARRTLQPLKEFCSQKHVTALVLHHSKRGEESRGRRRVADNDQLGAASSMSIVLKSRNLNSGTSAPLVRTPGAPPGELASSTSAPPSEIPGSPASAGPRVKAPNPLPAELAPADTQPSRLVTLHCEGRGMQINRIFHLVSHGLLDYQDTDRLEAHDHTDYNLDYSEAKVLEALKDGPLDSQQIIATARIQPSTARNAITNLRRNGKIAIVQVQNRRRVYERLDTAQKVRNSETSALTDNPNYGYHPMVTFAKSSHRRPKADAGPEAIARSPR